MNRWLLLFCLCSTGALARQAPWARPDVAISAKDRVCAADQTSNTVSVIDPATDKLLGVIKLGDPVPGALRPLYRRQLLVHGLGYSADSRTLAVVSVASNSVTVIDTASNKVKGVIYVGRSPHEAFFTPDGRELWISVRGENYVSVIDPVALKEARPIEMANGPGMTMFGPDGKYGFVCSSFAPELSVVEVSSHQIVKSVPQASPFCPNIAVSPENDEEWATLKDVGKVQIYSARPPFEQRERCGYRADHESREFREPSQRQIRLPDDRRREPGKSVPQERNTGAGSHHPGRKSSPRNLAFG